MKSLVLLSGGLDSAVALANEPSVIEALTVDYGQRHSREIDSARRLAAYYGVPHTIVSVDPRLFEGSALTTEAVPDGVAAEPDATYVPARNTVLLALAAARAEVIGAGIVVIGCNADDFNAYPDCRRKYLEAFRDVLSEGTLSHVWVSAPLLDLTKADVVALSKDLEVPVDMTWSCYRGGVVECGKCGACLTRIDAEWEVA